MTHGMPALFARLWSLSDHFDIPVRSERARRNRVEKEEMTEQQLRDIGIMDGRPSRQTLPRCERREQWWPMERPPTL